METLIEVTEGHTTMKLPLINLLRLTTVYMGQYLEEYRKNHKTEQITEFYKWVRNEKLGVNDAMGDRILL